jgi:hypothetical protein
MKSMMQRATSKSQADLGNRIEKHHNIVMDFNGKASESGKGVGVGVGVGVG